MISKKKKKGLRQNSGRFFSQFRKFKRLRGGSFRMGGAIFHFSQKIGLKSQKNMRFCILHKPMGPPPGYATGLGAKPFVNFWKKSYFNAIGSHFAGVQRSTFEKTRFFAFESQLKKLNCSILL